MDVFFCFQEFLIKKHIKKTWNILEKTLDVYNINIDV